MKKGSPDFNGSLEFVKKFANARCFFEVTYFVYEFFVYEFVKKMKIFTNYTSALEFKLNLN